MTRPPLANLRNIGIISHIDAGKTTVSERILFYTDAIHQMGEVHDGAAVMDWMEQERERGITISATATTCHWQGTEITLIDTPGHIDFTVEVERSLRVLDGAVVIFSAVEGVQPQSESVWRQADRYQVPRICLINKLDRIGADPQMVITQLRDRLGARPIPVQLPCGEESAFNGIIDLIDQCLLSFSDKDLGRTITALEIPAELATTAAAARNLLIETAADFDETILEDYLDNRPIVAERLRAALRMGTIRGAICPLFFAAALRNKGIQPLLDGINAYLPSPLDLPPLRARRLDRDEVVTLESDPRLPLCALAFKVVADEGRKLAYVRIYSGTIRPGDLIDTPRSGGSERVGRLFRMHAHRREPLAAAGAGEIVAITGLRQVLTGDTLCAPDHPLRLDGLTLPESVVSLAIEAKGVEDRARIDAALEKLQWEDPTFRVHEDPETGQTILTGMGELHLEVMLERLRREYGVQVASGPPQVVYRETIGTGIEHREVYQREHEGKSQYGEVSLRLVPLVRGEGLHLAGPPESGLPPELREHLVATLRQGCECGPLAGYPLTDLAVAIVAAPFIPGTTTEIGLRAALQRGLALALRAAAPLLLEPVMSLELTVPTDAAGRVLGIVQQKRGKIEGMSARDGHEILRAEAPLIELFGFMTELRSASKGRGSFSMTFSHYDPAPRERLQRLGLLGEERLLKPSSAP